MFTRISLAIAAVLLALFSGFAVGGAGHGWAYGSISCVPFAAIAFWSVLNALSPSPRRTVAIGLLLAGLIVCAATYVATATSELSSFLFVAERHPESLVLYLVPCLTWLIATSTPLLRNHR
jgi:hypothetical protein